MSTIHLYVEHRAPEDSDDYYSLFGKFFPSVEGNVEESEIFSHLAGVEEMDDHPCFVAPRGVCKQMSFEVYDDLFLNVIDDDENLEDGEVHRSDAESMVENGNSVWFDSGEDRVSSGRFHHIGYVSLVEFEVAVGEHINCPENYTWRLVLEAARGLAREGRDVRFYFWFED